MGNKIKACIIAVLTIAACVAIVTAGTYSLFTDGVTVGTHLSAGSLDVSLDRVALQSCTLNADGKLQVGEIDDSVVSFTGASEENVFGLSDGATVVPGCWYEATMRIGNGGSMAFDYSIEIAAESEANAFAEQLIVTVTHPDGTETEKTLAEVAAGSIAVASGEMKPDDTAQEFKVRVTFPDMDDDGEFNDAAKGQTVTFDLKVTATQATEAEAAE